jgi:hypothetical protein
MTYWLDLFTGTTWEEFRKAGANVTGFRERNWKRSEKVRPGDIFLCYLKPDFIDDIAEIYDPADEYDA